jgi:hypothetical protein
MKHRYFIFQTGEYSQPLKTSMRVYWKASAACGLRLGIYLQLMLTIPMKTEKE